MKFTMQGLAQASSKYLAEYRTWKMRQQLGPIQKSVDVGSGIGGDTIAMALRWKVLSIEKDPMIMDMLKHNVQVYNVEKNVTYIHGDILELVDDKDFQNRLIDINCIFFDPSTSKASMIAKSNALINLLIVFFITSAVLVYFKVT